MFNMPVTPEDPAPDQQRVLQEIYRWLTLKGRWPTFVQIDKILDRIGIDLQGISATFPRGLSSLGHRMMSDNDELSLLPEALVHCRPDSTDDMDLILRAVWHCEERERSHEPAEGAAMPNVTGQELESALGYPESRLLRVYFILQFDHWVAGSGIT